MNNILNLVKKELDKVFKNPRSIITNFILPGIIIFIIYTIIANVMSVNVSNIKNSEIKIAVVNNSEIFTNSFNAYNDALKKDDSGLNFKFINIDLEVEDFSRIIGYQKLENPTEKETEIYNNINKTLDSGDYDLWLCFNSDFDYKLSNPTELSTVGVFSKNTKEKSSYAFSIINSIIDSMQPKAILNFKVDFSTQDDMSINLLSTLIPMFLMVFIFAGGMSLCADSIAGEKERGTLSTLLMTPIKRSHIIYGKIISLFIMTIFAAIGPFIAVIVSIPKLLSSTGVNVEIGFNVLSGTAIAQIFFLVLAMALLTTSILLLLSTIAKSVKEATAFSSTVYLVVVVLTMIVSTLDMGNSIGFYFIPFMNISLAINGAITGELLISEILATVFSTLLYCIIFNLISIKLFNSEKILYSK